MSVRGTIAAAFLSAVTEFAGPYLPTMRAKRPYVRRLLPDPEREMAAIARREARNHRRKWCWARCEVRKHLLRPWDMERMNEARVRIYGPVVAAGLIARVDAND